MQHSCQGSDGALSAACTSCHAQRRRASRCGRSLLAGISLTGQPPSGCVLLEIPLLSRLCACCRPAAAAERSLRPFRPRTFGNGTDLSGKASLGTPIFGFLSTPHAFCRPDATAERPRRLLQTTQATHVGQWHGQHRHPGGHPHPCPQHGSLQIPQVGASLPSCAWCPSPTADSLQKTGWKVALSIFHAASWPSWACMFCLQVRCTPHCNGCMHMQVHAAEGPGRSIPAVQSWPPPVAAPCCRPSLVQQKQQHSSMTPPLALQQPCSEADKPCCTQVHAAGGPAEAAQLCGHGHPLWQPRAADVPVQHPTHQLDRGRLVQAPEQPARQHKDQRHRVGRHPHGQSLT